MPSSLSDKTSAPSLPPRGRQSARQFQALQRLAAAAIMRPLNRRWHIQAQWLDGRPSKSVIGDFIKPNDRLSSLQRLEIYNRQYWFRLIDCLYDDLPGLRAVIGQRRFNLLIRPYLARHPSQSFSLRDLASRLPAFVAARADLAGPRHQMAVEMACFEWAQIVAFDSAAEPPVSVDDLLGRDPSKLKLGVQPHLTALALNWPLDQFAIALKRHEMRTNASNAMAAGGRDHARKRRPTLPRRQKIFLVIHRLNNSLYYKRLDADAFALLEALRDGNTLQAACAAALKVRMKSPARTSTEPAAWFRQQLENWSAMGWFCRQRKSNSNGSPVHLPVE